MVRVLHATAWYPPRHLGGTEIYLSGLVRELRIQGVHSRITMPMENGEPHDYEFDSTVIRGYAVNDKPSRAELRGDALHQGFERFCELLDEERPDIYHQHSWTRGLGGAHLHAARQAGLKTVLTVHVPNSICLRGTMMRFGEEPCDGRIEPLRCAACWGAERGAPKLLAYALAAIPARVARDVGQINPAVHNRLCTALSARSLGERRKHEFQRMTDDADRIVAVSDWLLDTLRINQAPSEKLVMSRQGIDTNFETQLAVATAKPDNREGPANIIYLGRLHPVKGIHVLVRAAKAVPSDVPFSLAIHGVGNGPEEIAYAGEIQRLAAGDARIAMKAPIAREHVPDALLSADALAVPSLWLETGPLVVLEAKAACVPVIGSRLGGIAELVQEPDDGILVAPGDSAAWTEAIKTIVAQRTPRKAATRVRTMKDVAYDMATLYHSLM